MNSSFAGIGKVVKEGNVFLKIKRKMNFSDNPYAELNSIRNYKGEKFKAVNHPIASRRFVYCWEKNGEEWEKVGLLMSDDKGWLYNIEEYLFNILDIKETDNHKYNLPFIESGRWDVSLNRPYDLTSPEGVEYFDFESSDRVKKQVFKFKKRYYLTFFPVDIIFNRDSAAPKSETDGEDECMKIINDWVSERSSLLEAPKEKWLDDEQMIGSTVIINSNSVNNGAVLNTNFIECIALIWYKLRNIDLLNSWFSEYSDKHNHALLALDFTVDTLAAMLKFPEYIEMNGKSYSPCDNAEKNHIVREGGKLLEIKRMIGENYLDPKLISNNATGELLSQAIERNLTDMYLLLKSDELNTFIHSYDQHDFQPFISTLRDNIIGDIFTESMLMLSLSSNSEIKETFFRNEVVPFLFKVSSEFDKNDSETVKELFSRDVIEELFTYTENVSRNRLKHLIDNDLTAEKSKSETQDLFKTVFSVNEDTLVKSSLLDVINSSPLKDCYVNQIGLDSNVAVVIKAYHSNITQAVFNSPNLLKGVQAGFFAFKGNLKLSYNEHFKRAKELNYSKKLSQPGGEAKVKEELRNIWKKRHPNIRSSTLTKNVNREIKAYKKVTAYPKMPERHTGLLKYVNKLYTAKSPDMKYNGVAPTSISLVLSSFSLLTSCMAMWQFREEWGDKTKRGELSGIAQAIHVIKFTRMVLDTAVAFSGLLPAAFKELKLLANFSNLWVLW